MGYDQNRTELRWVNSKMRVCCLTYVDLGAKAYTYNLHDEKKIVRISNVLFPELAKYLNSNVKLAANGCLEWDSCISPEGYGIALETIRKEYGTSLVHRLVYLCTYGFFPTGGLVVRHTCGNKACCHPGHLRDGTPGEVAEDRAKRGLTPRGEKHWRAVLTANDVVSIRSSDLKHTVIARQFGVTPLTIHNIRKRKTWKHVA